MAEPLLAVPPAALFALAALLVAVLPRRAGATVGVVLSWTTVAWLAVVPVGTHLQAGFLGFPVVLFRVDPLSRTLGLILAFAAGAAVAYGHETGASRRQGALSLAYLGAGLGAALAGDWLTLLVAWELLAVGATALVWTGGDAAARRAGLRYAVYHELGGLALLSAVLLHYRRVGTFVYGAGLAEGLPALLGAVGIGLNVAVLGLHPWLVDAYPRPHVATSVVLVACTTKVGVYALARAFPSGHLVLAYVGGLMLLVGVTYAVLQTDLRRLLAYHVVSQVGIMVAGVGIGSPLALAGAVAHLVNNVLYKSLLFAVAGLLIHRTGASRLGDVAGHGRRLPLTFSAFVVAAAAISGVPGFNGFVSKAMVVDAAEDAGLDALWWALLVGSVGTVVSFAKFGYYAFLYRGGGEAQSGQPAPVDASWAGTLALAALAIPCVVFGLAPDLQFAVLPGDPWAAMPFAASQFRKAGGVLGAGAVTYLALRPALGRVRGAPDLDSVYHPAGSWLLFAVVGAVARTGAGLDALSGRARDAVVRAIAGPWPGPLDSPGSGREDAVGWSLLLLVATLAVVLVVAFA